MLAIALVPAALIVTRPMAKPELKVLAPLRVETVAVQRRDIQPYDAITGRLRPGPSCIRSPWQPH